MKLFLSDPDYAAGTPGLADAVLAAARRPARLTLRALRGRRDDQAGRPEADRGGRGAIALTSPRRRPVVAEVVRHEQAVAIAERTGAPVYIVHLSSQRALDVCAEARARGVPVYVETRPLYLHLTSERLAEPDAADYVGQPPLREASDVQALWAGLASGEVDTVCTDHAPWSLAAKLAADHTRSTHLRPGVENLQTLLPMLYSEGVRERPHLAPTTGRA